MPECITCAMCSRPGACETTDAAPPLCRSVGERRALTSPAGEEGGGVPERLAASSACAATTTSTTRRASLQRGVRKREGGRERERDVHNTPVYAHGSMCTRGGFMLMLCI